MDNAAHESLDPKRLGIQSERERPFEFCPGRDWSPVVLSFPHVGLQWPSSLGPVPRVDFRRHADYAVDRLVGEVAEFGVASLRARFSRLVVDLNRGPDDVSAELVPDHPAPRPRNASNALIEMTRARQISSTPEAKPSSPPPRPHPHRGVLWSESLSRKRLLQKITYARFCDRLARFYDPYHRALECLLERRRRRFGYAILIDVHSMPSFVGPDVVVGTQHGRSCDPAILDKLRFFFPPCPQTVPDHPAAAKSPPLPPCSSRPPSMRCSYDHPYPGGHITRRFGQPKTGQHAVQLEFNRALYLDEHSFRLNLPPPLARSRPEKSEFSKAKDNGGVAASRGGRGEFDEGIGTPSSEAVRHRVHALLLELSDRSFLGENLEPMQVGE